MALQIGVPKLTFEWLFGIDDSALALQTAQADLMV
jgi:hypothetical protein